MKKNQIITLDLGRSCLNNLKVLNLQIIYAYSLNPIQLKITKDYIIVSLIKYAKQNKILPQNNQQSKKINKRT